MQPTTRGLLSSSSSSSFPSSSAGLYSPQGLPSFAFGLEHAAGIQPARLPHASSPSLLSGGTTQHNHEAQLFTFVEDIQLSPPPQDLVTDAASPAARCHELPSTATPASPSQGGSPVSSYESELSPCLEIQNANKIIAEMSHTIQHLQHRVLELENIIATRDRAESSCSSASCNSSHDSPRRLSVESNDETNHALEMVSVTPNHSAAKAAPSPSVSAANQGELMLELSGDMEHQWYADRPYPAFKLRLVDLASGEAVVPVAPFKIALRLLDGFGEPSNKLGGSAVAHDFQFESDVVTGEVTIDGIRFTQVSSKCGGHFSVLAEVVEGDIQEVTQPFSSSRVTVLSYRLFNAPKLDFDKLNPQDSLTKVKGIGSLYAKRFKELGLATVGDLAQLETEQDQATGTPSPVVQMLKSRNNKRKAIAKALNSGEVVESLRKVRGALTRAKLDELVVQAREVVTRHMGEKKHVKGMPATLPSAQKRGRESVLTVSVGDITSAKTSNCFVSPAEYWSQSHSEVNANVSTTNVAKRPRVALPAVSCPTLSRGSSSELGDSAAFSADVFGNGVCEPSLPPLFSAF